MSDQPVDFTVTSVSEFSAKLAERYFRSERGQWVFRGQSSHRFSLVPKVGRVEYTAALSPDLDGLTAHLQWQHGVAPHQIFEP